MTRGHFRGCLQFSFAKLKKPAIHIFFQNLSLHLLSFPTIYWKAYRITIYSLPCFPLKWHAYEFFSRRTPAKVRSNRKLYCHKLRLLVLKMLGTFSNDDGKTHINSIFAFFHSTLGIIPTHVISLK